MKINLDSSRTTLHLDPERKKQAGEMAKKLNLSFTQYIEKLISEAEKYNPDIAKKMQEIEGQIRSMALALNMLATSAIDPELIKATQKTIALQDRPPHLQAAAGVGGIDIDSFDPLTQDDIDADLKKGLVRVGISGASMEPTFKDGETVTMRHRSTAKRSLKPKKNMIYLWNYGGNYFAKRYDTRPPTKAERASVDDDYLMDGKLQLLKSDNEEVPDIIVQDECKWIAWFEEK